VNFELSDDSLIARDQARAFLRDNCGTAGARRVLEGREPYAAALWRQMAELGWLGASIPERFGGAGLGYELVCVLAEELGRVVAPVPFASSIYLAAEAVLAAGSDMQKREWLPGIASGARIGTFAFDEGLGFPEIGGIRARVSDGKLAGDKWPVLDGTIADFAIVAARDQVGIGLYSVDLAQTSIERTALRSLDPTRGYARLIFNGAHAERLGEVTDHRSILERLLERAAVMMSFEQLGGAEACLQMSRDYALERFAFGRPIASFQAIKHKLADIYVDIEIARSHAYFGAWALSHDDPMLSLAACSARVAANEAFRIAAQENIQIHGGAGFTWDYDCQLFYRRAKILALAIGSTPFWSNRLVDRIEPSTEKSDGL
jgi:acyl-CoA dehydrogenase